MRVTGVRTTIVSMPFTEVEHHSMGYDDMATEVIVQVDTDEGIIGIGEALATFCPEAVDVAIKHLARFIVGYSPHDIESFYDRAFQGRWQYFRHFGHTAFAGIEIALWDIIGKAANQPVHRLMGGAFRDRVDHYCWIQRKDPALREEEARRGREAGFTVFYTKVGIDMRSDLEAVAALRSGAGQDALLRVDANAVWTPAQAVRMIRELDKFGMDFVEQPIVILDVDGLIHIREVTGVSICIDQAAWTQWDIATVVRRQAADVVCAEPARCGGLLEFKKACAVADLANVQICRHVGPELGIMSAAALQVCATARNLVLGNQTWVPLLPDDIINEDLRTFTNGTLPVPTRPGLGVTINEEKLAAYAELYARSQQSSSGAYRKV